MTETVKIEPVKGTALAEDKDATRQLRIERILPALERGDTVELDFSEVGLATQSYIHALISEAVRRFGTTALKHLRFAGCNEDVKQVIRAVVRYTNAAAAVAVVPEADNNGNTSP